MKKLALAGVLALAFVASGCALAQKYLPKTTAFICSNEPRAHDEYMRLVAPFRTAAQVAKAQAFHATLMQRCAAGATPASIDKAVADANAARS